MGILHTKPAIAANDISERVQDLPQELYDIIYQYTFTAEFGEVEINADYKTPKLLAVDRASRHLYAKSHYRGRTFCIAHLSNDHRDLFRWLKSLPSDHQAMIREIRFESPHQYSGHEQDDHENAKSLAGPALIRCHNDWVALLEARGFGIVKAAVRVDGYFYRLGYEVYVLKD